MSHVRYFAKTVLFHLFLVKKLSISIDAVYCPCTVDCAYIVYMLWRITYILAYWALWSLHAWLPCETLRENTEKHIRTRHKMSAADICLSSWRAWQLCADGLTLSPGGPGGPESPCFPRGPCLIKKTNVFKYKVPKKPIYLFGQPIRLSELYIHHLKHH